MLSYSADCAVVVRSFGETQFDCIVDQRAEVDAACCAGLSTIESSGAESVDFSSSTYCVECMDLTIDLLDGALEDILRGDVFLGCVDFCNYIGSNQYCIALCVIVGETALNEGEYVRSLMILTLNTKYTS